MTTDQFAYWLKGFFEIDNPKELNEKQTQIIKDHLDLVFNKVTPERSYSPSHTDEDGLLCCTTSRAHIC